MVSLCGLHGPAISASRNLPDVGTQLSDRHWRGHGSRRRVARHGRARGHRGGAGGRRARRGGAPPPRSPPAVAGRQPARVAPPLAARTLSRPHPGQRGLAARAPCWPPPGSKETGRPPAVRRRAGDHAPARGGGARTPDASGLGRRAGEAGARLRHVRRAHGPGAGCNGARGRILGERGASASRRRHRGAAAPTIPDPRRPEVLDLQAGSAAGALPGGRHGERPSAGWGRRARGGASWGRGPELASALPAAR